MAVITTEPKGSTSPINSKPTEREPLWPNGMAIEVIGLTGEFGVGKTIFGLSIAPGKETLVYDMEKSSSVYQSLGFARIDMADEMLKRFGNKIYQPEDLYAAWRESILAITPGKYRVIMLDPVSEIESGIVEHIRKNPEKYGLTAKQIERAEGLLWGRMKDVWKNILVDLSARCETFVFVSHMRAVFRDNRPVPGRKQPKGKETLMELASLYLRLERVPDVKGNVPEVPSAIVIKNRLSVPRFEGGSLSWVNVLPPRIPVATPAAIREYIQHPPDYAKLKPAERAPEEHASEEELAMMKLATAEAQRDAEQARLERLTRATQVSSQPTQANANPSTATNGHSAIAPKGTITTEQVGVLVEFRKSLGIDKDTWLKILAKRGVASGHALSTEQAAELIDALSKKLMSKMFVDTVGSLPGAEVEDRKN